MERSKGGPFFFCGCCPTQIPLCLCHMWCRIREMHVAHVCLITSVGRKKKPYETIPVCVIMHNRTAGLIQYLHNAWVHLCADRGNYPLLILLSKPLAWFVLTGFGGFGRHESMRTRCCNYARRGLQVQSQSAFGASGGASTARWSFWTVGLFQKRIPLEKKKKLNISFPGWKQARLRPQKLKHRVLFNHFYTPCLGTRIPSFKMDATSVALLFSEFQKLHVNRVPTPRPI